MGTGLEWVKPVVSATKPAQDRRGAPKMSFQLRLGQLPHAQWSSLKLGFDYSERARA